MKKAKIVLRLKDLSDSELYRQASAIAAAMNNNPHFTEPKPSLADLNNSLQLFSDKLDEAKTGDRVKAILKNQQRDNLELILANLANYCGYIAQGDRAILASSNFSLNAETNTARTLANPQNFTVEVGSKAGEALVYVNPVANAKAYLFRWAVAPVVNEVWSHTMHSQPWINIPGLSSGTAYSFQIGVAGAKGQTVFTEILTKMVA